jgi:hypothetical protein
LVLNLLSDNIIKLNNIMEKRIVKIFNLVILSGMLILLTTRCVKLEEDPRDFVGPDNYYVSAAQIESAFVSAMQRLWGGWQFYDWQGYPEWPALDEQVYGGDLVIGDYFGTGSWEVHYEAIADVNPAIKSMVEDKLGTSVTQEEKDQLMAQAKFLRGFNYFWLVRLYGDIPLITDATDVVNEEITRRPVSEVYDFIVSDLLFATQHLPTQWTADKIARPTADAAKALLAKVYVTMATYPLQDASKYADARAMAKQVMDDGRYSLVPAVEDVFALENEFGPEFMWSFHNSEEEYVIEPQIWLPGEMAGGWGDVTAEKIWGEAFPDEPRKDAYLLLEDIWNHETTYLDWWKSAPYIRKFLYDSEENAIKNVSYQSQPLIRYADVLLLFAEADNMVNGPTQEACDAVNQIILRATGGDANHPDDPLFTTAMSQAEFDAAVIHQRGLELCFEYDRWFDICRKRILDQVCDPDYLPNFSPEDYLMPIPQKDLRLNPLLTQNPGYTTPDR